MKTICIAATLLAISAMVPAAADAAGTLTREDYSAAKARIKADYKSARTSCDVLAGNARDICVAEAKGNEMTANAELEFQLTGSKKKEYEFRVAKADAAYSVAKEKCDDKRGNDKDVCVKTAKADFMKAKADIKLEKTVANATRDNIDDRIDADYKVAVEKCDVLAGDAKRSCISAAKAKFGKA